MTELEAALSAQVTSLEAELEAKDAELASTKSNAHAAVDAEAKYADELAEAVGGVETAKQVIEQHRQRKAMKRERELLDELAKLRAEVLDRPWTEF